MNTNTNALRAAQIRDAETECAEWITTAANGGPAKVRVQRRQEWGAGKVVWVNMNHPYFEAWICLSGGKESRIWVRGGEFRNPRTKDLVRKWIRSLGGLAFAAVVEAGELPAEPRLKMKQDSFFGSYPVGPEQVSNMGAWVELPL